MIFSHHPERIAQQI